MPPRLPDDINKLIVDRAKTLGASLAGIADVDVVKSSPSHKEPAKVKWDTSDKSLIVLVVEHGEAEPHLDWWDDKPGHTPGIRDLYRIGKQLREWLLSEFGIQSEVLPYSIGRGGIYLKDAAVLAGLGCVGKNNLFISPEFGPRVRLGAMTVDAKLEPAGPVDFDPCDGCSMPCRTACPRDAFGDGNFSLESCRKQMNQDETEAVKDILRGFVVKYCRDCELACPVGGKQ